jgi:sugar phosphate isomerase/epimerase
MELVRDLGSRLTHLHLADGSGALGRDEHLVPGRGTQPCAEVLGALMQGGFDGVVVVEISTRKARTREERENDLADALGYTRRHLQAFAQDLP